MFVLGTTIGAAIGVVATITSDGNPKLAINWIVRFGSAKLVELLSKFSAHKLTLISWFGIILDIGLLYKIPPIPAVPPILTHKNLPLTSVPLVVWSFGSFHSPYLGFILAVTPYSPSLINLSGLQLNPVRGAPDWFSKQ